MRQGQPQNRQRSRGRGNNNRNNNNRNQLNRSMESNGPDVRIRGTASHIAEKYTQLARDAQSAGDNVAAESYWQHAEHYNRLIAVAQAAQQQQRDEQRAQQGAQQGAEESEADSEQPAADGESNSGRNRGRGRRPRPTEGTEGDANAATPNGAGPQPILNEVPAEVALKEQAVADQPAEEVPAKTRRPRKKPDPAPPAAEATNELPAFISGVSEE